MKKECQKLCSGKPVVFFCLIMIVLINANLHAQEAAVVSEDNAPIRLTPDEAVELALRNNLGLASSRVNLETRRRASSLSWNQFIPNVSIAGTYNRDNTSSVREGMAPFAWDDMLSLAGLNKDQFELSIPLPGGGTQTLYHYVMPYSFAVPQWQLIATLQVSLNLNAAMFENMNRLRLDYETGILSYEKAKAQLERDIRKAYHNILLLQENINLLRGSFANVERQVQMAQANYNAGFAPELTLLQARVARENMRPVIDQAENGLKLSLAQFAMYLGMGYDSQIELVPISDNINFIPLDVTEMISQAASGKPDIMELRHTILMLESARKIQVFALTPSLNLGWNTNQAFLINPVDDKWQRVGQGSLSITVALRLHSLIPYSADSQGIRNLEDQIRTANIGLAQLVNGTEIEVYNIVLSLERIHLNTQVQTQTVALAEQAYRLTEQAYRAGFQDYFQVQSAEQSLHQARVQLLEQQFNYLNGLIDLEYAIGVPFGTLSKRSEQ
ncbi:MAG: TolC family protein [Treponema sp.]|nr:TolC family protein [Treponema sp.]